MYSYSTRGFISIANIKNLLDTDTTTLEDILEEGDVIQECHAENHILVDFFCREENLRKILLYTVGFHPETDQFSPLVGDNRISKYAFLCCELLCSEIDKLLKAYLSGKGKRHFVRYLSFLSNRNAPEMRNNSAKRPNQTIENGDAQNANQKKMEDQLSKSSISIENMQFTESSFSCGHLEALYFYRVISAFLQFNPFILAQFVRDEIPDFPLYLLRHLNSSSIVDLIAKLIWNESFDSIENGVFIDLMVEKNFFQRLFERCFCLRNSNSIGDDEMSCKDNDENASVDESNSCDQNSKCSSLDSASLDETMAGQQILLSLASHTKRNQIFIDLFLEGNNVKMFFDLILSIATPEHTNYQSMFERKEKLAIYVDFFKSALPLLSSSKSFVSLIEGIIEIYIQKCVDLIEILSKDQLNKNENNKNKNESKNTNKNESKNTNKNENKTTNKNENIQSNQPLGMVRLKLCHFLSLLISLVPHSEIISQAVASGNALQLLVNLFFTFKRNNFLHSLLVDSLVSLVDNPNNTNCDFLLVHLLIQTNLLQLTIKAFRNQSAAKVLPLGGSPDSTVSYMGHLVVVCDLICKYTTNHQNLPVPLKERLGEEDWETLLVTNYASAKTAEMSLLGGPIPFSESDCSDSTLLFTEKELVDFEYISVQEEQLGRLIVQRISDTVHMSSDEDEEQTNGRKSDSEFIFKSLGIIFNQGPPSEL